MNKFFILSCAVLLIVVNSCRSKRSTLIESQRIASDSLKYITNEIGANMLIRAEAMRDSLNKLHPEWQGQGLLNTAINLDTLSYGQSDEMNALKKKRNLFQREYDSLEFEIKKF